MSIDNRVFPFNSLLESDLRVNDNIIYIDNSDILKTGEKFDITVSNNETVDYIEIQYNADVNVFRITKRNINNIGEVISGNPYSAGSKVAITNFPILEEVRTVVSTPLDQRIGELSNAQKNNIRNEIISEALYDFSNLQGRIDNNSQLISSVRRDITDIFSEIQRNTSSITTLNNNTITQEQADAILSNTNKLNNIDAVVNGETLTITLPNGNEVSFVVSNDGLNPEDEQRLNDAIQNIATHTTEITNLENDVNQLKLDRDSAKNDIVGILNRLTSAEGSITQAQADILTNAGQVARISVFERNGAIVFINSEGVESTIDISTSGGGTSLTSEQIADIDSIPSILERITSVEAEIITLRQEIRDAVQTNKQTDTNDKTDLFTITGVGEDGIITSEEYELNFTGISFGDIILDEPTSITVRVVGTPTNIIGFHPQVHTARLFKGTHLVDEKSNLSYSAFILNEEITFQLFGNLTQEQYNNDDDFSIQLLVSGRTERDENTVSVTASNFILYKQGILFKAIETLISDYLEFPESEIEELKNRFNNLQTGTSLSTEDLRKLSSLVLQTSTNEIPHLLRVLEGENRIAPEFSGEQTIEIYNVGANTSHLSIQIPSPVSQTFRIKRVRGGNTHYITLSNTDYYASDENNFYADLDVEEGDVISFVSVSPVYSVKVQDDVKDILDRLEEIENLENTQNEALSFLSNNIEKDREENSETTETDLGRLVSVARDEGKTSSATGRFNVDGTHIVSKIIAFEFQELSNNDVLTPLLFANDGEQSGAQRDAILNLRNGRLFVPVLRPAIDATTKQEKVYLLQQNDIQNTFLFDSGSIETDNVEVILTRNLPTESTPVRLNFNFTVNGNSEPQNETDILLQVGEGVEDTQSVTSRGITITASTSVNSFNGVREVIVSFVRVDYSSLVHYQIEGTASYDRMVNIPGTPQHTEQVELSNRVVLDSNGTIDEVIFLTLDSNGNTLISGSSNRVISLGIGADTLFQSSRAGFVEVPNATRLSVFNSGISVFSPFILANDVFRTLKHNFETNVEDLGLYKTTNSYQDILTIFAVLRIIDPNTGEIVTAGAGGGGLGTGEVRNETGEVLILHKPSQSAVPSVDITTEQLQNYHSIKIALAQNLGSSSVDSNIFITAFLLDSSNYFADNNYYMLDDRQSNSPNKLRVLKTDSGITITSVGGNNISTNLIREVALIPKINFVYQENVEEVIFSEDIIFNTTDNRFSFDNDPTHDLTHQIEFLGFGSFPDFTVTQLGSRGSAYILPSRTWFNLGENIFSGNEYDNRYFVVYGSETTGDDSSVINQRGQNIVNRLKIKDIKRNGDLGVSLHLSYENAAQNPSSGISFRIQNGQMQVSAQGGAIDENSPELISYIGID